LELTKAQFKAIFDTYYNPLCNFCCKYLKDRSDVEDVVQDVLVKLWQNKDKIHLQKDVKYYLFTSVKNKAIELIRSRKRKGEILDTLTPEKKFEDPVGDEVDSTILKEKLYNSIRQSMKYPKSLKYPPKLSIIRCAGHLSYYERNLESQNKRAL